MATINSKGRTMKPVTLKTTGTYASYGKAVSPAKGTFDSGGYATLVLCAALYVLKLLIN